MATIYRNHLRVLFCVLLIGYLIQDTYFFLKYWSDIQANHGWFNKSLLITFVQSLHMIVIVYRVDLGALLFGLAITTLSPFEFDQEPVMMTLCFFLLYVAPIIYLIHMKGKRLQAIGSKNKI